MMDDAAHSRPVGRTRREAPEILLSKYLGWAEELKDLPPDERARILSERSLRLLGKACGMRERDWGAS